GGLAIRLRAAVRETAGRDEGVELGILAQDVLHLLHRAREVVVGVERAAGHLGPAVLAGELVAGRLRALGAGQRVADALHALVVLGPGRPPRLDPHAPS